MLKAVIDTNQFVSGLINHHGSSFQLLEAWRSQDFILITADEIILEMRRVLHYPRIMRKYHLSAQDVDTFVHTVEHNAIVLSHLPILKVIKDDPDDDKILACAVTAEADYIVSGDSHLLDLQFFKNIPIITVKEFLKLL